MAGDYHSNSSAASLSRGQRRSLSERTGPPAGVVSVGGYRFVLPRLQDAVSRIEPGAMIAAFPDGLTGQRIAGNAARREELQDALTQLGHSPLVVDAFRQRRAADGARSAA